MRLLMCLLPAGVLLFAQSVSAQMQPHRADYVLRLGTAINAPRVGTATQDLTLDCAAWHLKRDVKGVILVAATNRPGRIEPALLRSGRFDYIVPFTKPDAAERADIMRICCQRVPLCPRTDSRPGA